MTKKRGPLSSGGASNPNRRILTHLQRLVHLPEPRTARGARDPRLAPGSTLLAANVCIASIERAMGRVRRPFVARDPIFYPKFV